LPESPEPIDHTVEAGAEPAVDPLIAPDGAAPGQRRFPCSKCGGKLEFAPGTRSLTCPYCGTLNEIDGGDVPVEERDFVAAIQSLKDAAPLVQRLVVKCDACAAEMERPPNVTSFSCPFCGSNIVATASAATLIKPWGVLPFLVKREQADSKFRAWLRSRWFAPNALKREGLLDERISGVYVPAWTYDADTVTPYTGQRGDAYYVTVGSGKNRRTVRRIRWTSVSGVVRHDFDDVVVLASRSLPTDKADRLEPWDTDSVVPYKDDYLAGFKAECYTIGVEDGFVRAQGIMTDYIEGLIRSEIGGDEQRITSMHVSYNHITFKHLLLPVWISAYRFRQRVYRFLVNARTGEVQGERPYSWIKITLAVLLGLAVIGVLVYFTAQR
jgi:DNA-directed RNA polymerase subunit RPC12/RpoP